MANPTDLKYTRDHEWIRPKAGEATVGITEYAAKQLGDVVYVELPSQIEEVEINETFGSIESVKAVSELYAPVSGKIVARNAAFDEAPETVNDDPYGEGWLIRVKMSNAKELDEHMTSAQYEAFLKTTEEPD